jgi:hypothetical protein
MKTEIARWILGALLLFGAALIFSRGRSGEAAPTAYQIIRLNDVCFVTMETSSGASKLHVLNRGAYEVRDLANEELQALLTAKAQAQIAAQPDR